MKVGIAIIAFALLSSASMGASAADSTDSRPVRFLIPSSPGGGTDLIARVLGQYLGERWGQPVVMDNRSGATGYVALELLARSAPDGHTLAIFNLGHMQVAQDMGKLSFKQGGDFTPISIVVTTPLLMVVHPSVQAKTVKELVDYAKAHPGELNFASGGTGGSAHIAVALFDSMTGINMTHVPYKGVSPSIVDLLAGRVQLVLTAVPVVASYVQNGRLRALAVTGTKRVPTLPDVPTFAEAGFPNYDTSAWYGLFGPGHMPAALVARLNADSNIITKQPEVAARLITEGIYTTGGMSPDKFGDFARSELVKWNQGMKAAGIEKQ